MTIVVAMIAGIQDGSWSSWDSDSSWSSWDSGSSWDYDSGDGSDAFFLGMLFADNPGLFLIVVIIIIIISATSKSSKYRQKQESMAKIRRADNVMRDYMENRQREPEIYQGPIELEVQKVDELFQAEEFNQFAKMLFVKMQQAWTERDWNTIRPFETNELFEQHQMQIQGYITSKTINVMDRICVLYSKLYKFEQTGDKDILIVVIKARMKDYIIDEDTKKVIQGDKDIEKTKYYTMEFIRKAGVKTKEGDNKLKTTNCPNCGAPTKVTSSGECEYCKSIITTGEYDWVLNNIEPFKF